MQPKLLNQTRLLANLMTKGVSKSLTRSAAIGGREAAQSVSQLIVRGVVQGPALVPGQDTRAILQELGYDDTRIDALAEAKTILDWRP